MQGGKPAVGDPKNSFSSASSRHFARNKTHPPPQKLEPGGGDAGDDAEDDMGVRANFLYLGLLLFVL